MIVRYDPSLNRAVEFALAEGLVQRSEQPQFDSTSESSPAPYRIALTAKGRQLVQELLKEDDCLQTEKEFLKEIGRKVTQKQVQSLFTWEET